MRDVTKNPSHFPNLQTLPLLEINPYRASHRPAAAQNATAGSESHPSKGFRVQVKRAGRGTGHGSVGRDSRGQEGRRSPLGRARSATGWPPARPASARGVPAVPAPRTPGALRGIPAVRCPLEPPAPPNAVPRSNYLRSDLSRGWGLFPCEEPARPSPLCAGRAAGRAAGSPRQLRASGRLLSLERRHGGLLGKKNKIIKRGNRSPARTRAPGLPLPRPQGHRAPPAAPGPARPAAPPGPPRPDPPRRGPRP